MLDTNKKGIIILTHYRSGGTLLRAILEVVFRAHLEFFNIEDTGEIDFIDGSYDYDTKVNYKKHIEKTFFYTENKFKIIQLNNPLVISFLANSNYFAEINSTFNIIHLERNNISKSILSLPLVERFYPFKKQNQSLKQDQLMKSFHEHLLKNPIDYSEVYTGIHFATPNLENYRNYLDYQLMLLTNRVHINRYISSKYNLFSLKYEDYEYELKENFFKLFKGLNIENQDIEEIVKNKQQHKINYLSNNYIEYFDDKTKEVFEYWNL